MLPNKYFTRISSSTHRHRGTTILCPLLDQRHFPLPRRQNFKIHRNRRKKKLIPHLLTRGDQRLGLELLRHRHEAFFLPLLCACAILAAERAVLPRRASHRVHHLTHAAESSSLHPILVRHSFKLRSKLGTLIQPVLLIQGSGRWGANKCEQKGGGGLPRPIQIPSQVPPI
jgi:hypothetical protein